jgi:hypothetical protein
MLLKPRPRPIVPRKPKRLPERKRHQMTLVNAFRCLNGGILLCADREENDGYNKREVDKIVRIRELHAFEVFIAGAGPSGVITKTCGEIHQSLLKAEYGGDDLWNGHTRLMESVLKSIHEQYAEHLASYPMNLLIVVAERTRYSPLLYRTELEMLIPETTYAACGTGKPISDYLSDRLYAYGRLESRATGILAAFISREAQDSSYGVGLGTDMVFIHEGDKSLYFIHPPKVKELQECIPTLGECVNSSWPSKVTVPAWFKDWW